MRTCAECGAAASGNSKFCRSCGAKIEAEAISDNIIICQNCQEPIEEGEQFCSNCGQPVNPVQDQSEAGDEPVRDEPGILDESGELAAETEADGEEAVIPDESEETAAQDTAEDSELPVVLPILNSAGSTDPSAPQEQANTEGSTGVVFCPKCGSQLSGDAVFCRSCGHNIKLSRQSTAATAHQAAAPAASYMPPPPPSAWQPPVSTAQPAPQEKKHKGLLIGLLILLIVALLAGAAYLLAGRTIRRLILGNKATYLAIEGQQLRQDAADLTELLADIGNKPEKPAVGGHNVQFNIDLNDNAAVMDPVMQTALENITWRSQILYDLETSPAQYYAELELLTSSEPLLVIEGYYDQEQLIVGLPGIISQYLRAQRNTIDDYTSDMGLDEEDTDQAFGVLDLLLNPDMGIDQPAMQKSFFTLIDIVLSHIDAVEYTAKQDLSAGPVSAKYDRFTMTVSDENAYQMTREILEVLRDDTELFKLISSMSELGQSVDSDSFDIQPVFTLEQWQQSIDLLIEELDRDWETAEPFTIVQDIYVNKDDQIFGRDLKILDQTGSVSFRFENYQPEADEQAAVLLRITSEGEEFEYRNIYQHIDDKLDGELTMSSSNQLLAEIAYSQYEIVAVGSRSYILGDFTISLHDQSGSSAPTIIQYQGSLSDERIVMKLGTPDLGSIEISYQEIGQQEVVMPSFSSDQLVDVDDWQALAELMTEDTMNELFRIINQLGFDPGILYE